MNQEHRNALKSSRYEICQDLDAESVLTYLFAKDILQKGHVDEIMAISRRDTRNMQLMKYVVEGGPTAFNEFINALKISGKGFLADKILAHLQPSQDALFTSANSLMNSLKESYLEIFRKVCPFSLPFTFDIENTWVSLALREEKKSSNATEDHAELLRRAFSKAKMLIIEGKAATGKTSLMRRLAYEWAQQRSQQMVHFDLVLYAEFRAVSDRNFETIAELMHSCLKTYLKRKDCDELVDDLTDEEYCTNHQILLLLDGYDESSSEIQCKELYDYLATAKIIKTMQFNIVLTTRPGYLTKHRGQEGKFVFADVLGFTTEEQKQKYIHNHFSAKEETDTTENIEAVQQLLKSNKNLTKLAEIPLFLAFICLVHERIVDGTTLELYLNIIWWLLDRHQKSFTNRDVPNLFGFQGKPNDDKFQIIQDHYLKFPQLHSLGSMALQNIKTDVFKKTDLDKFQLKETCEQVGFLIKGEKRDESFRRTGEFCFPHRTLQEFLAAISYFSTQVILNDSNEFMVRDIFNKTFSASSGKTIMTEYEKFLWRILISEKIPISPETQLNFFSSYSTLVLDLDIFSSSADISFQQLMTYIGKCSYITLLFLYSLTSDKILLNEPIDLSRLITLQSFHMHGMESTHTNEREVSNVNLESITFKSAALFSETINHFKKFFNLESTIQLNNVTVTSNFDEFSLFTVSTRSETFSKFFSNEKFAKIFANVHLNEAMQFSQYVETLYISEPERVLSSPLVIAEFSTLSKLVLKHFEFHSVENPINSTDMSVLNYFSLEYGQLMANLPALTTLTFDGCSVQENFKFDMSNLPALTTLRFRNCSFQENCKFDIANSPALTTLRFRDCSFQENFKFDIANMPVLTDLEFDGCSFQENFKFDIASSPAVTTLKFDYCSFLENFKLDSANSPALTTLKFDGCSFQDYLKLDLANSPALTTLRFWKCSSQENFKFVIANSAALTTLKFYDCSFQGNFELDSANSSALTTLVFDGCSFQENFKFDIADLLVSEDIHFESCLFQGNLQVNCTNSPVLDQWYLDCSWYVECLQHFSSN